MEINYIVEKLETEGKVCKKLIKFILHSLLG